jgi:superfamily II DNA or RNA helicase
VSLQSLLEYMGIDTDLIIIDEIHDFTTEPAEGPESDCS